MSGSPVRTLVLGIGNPWLGDLDFGPRFVRRYAARRWPRGVVVEESTVAAQHVLHRLWEAAPRSLVVVAAYPRDMPPGTIRLAPIDPTPPPDDEVQARLAESVGGVVDVEHVLAVLRFYAALPPAAYALEVEPAETAFGDRFSSIVSAAFDAAHELLCALLPRLSDSGTDAVTTGLARPTARP